MKFIKKLRHQFPSKLPQTKDALDQFAADIIRAHGLPDTPEMKLSIVTMIMHVPPHKASAPKQFFATAAKKAIATRVAFDVGQELKALLKAQAERKPAELEQGSAVESVQNEAIQVSAN